MIYLLTFDVWAYTNERNEWKRMQKRDAAAPPQPHKLNQQNVIRCVISRKQESSKTSPRWDAKGELDRHVIFAHTFCALCHAMCALHVTRNVIYVKFYFISDVHGSTFIWVCKCACVWALWKSIFIVVDTKIVMHIDRHMHISHTHT